MAMPFFGSGLLRSGRPVRSVLLMESGRLVSRDVLSKRFFCEVGSVVPLDWEAQTPWAC